MKFIFFSSVCYPWLKLVWCVHSTYKPDLIFIFVDKFVNSGWPVKLGMMKTTWQTNEKKIYEKPSEKKTIYDTNSYTKEDIIAQLHKLHGGWNRVLCFTFNSSPHSGGAMSFTYYYFFRLYFVYLFVWFLGKFHFDSVTVHHTMRCFEFV